MAMKESMDSLLGRFRRASSDAGAETAMGKPATVVKAVAARIPSTVVPRRPPPGERTFGTALQSARNGSGSPVSRGPAIPAAPTMQAIVDESQYEEDEDDLPEIRIAKAPSKASGALVPQSNAVKRDPKEMFASEEEVARFLAYEGEVLTTYGGKLQATDGQRTNAAYLANGTLLVAKGRGIEAKTMQLRSTLRRAGMSVALERHVDLDVVRRIHENADRLFGSQRSNRVAKPEEMQKAFFQLIAASAARNCSDIRVRVDRFETKMRVHCDGIVEAYGQETTSWGQALCAAAFNMADASANNYRPLEYQDARISNMRVPLPEGVQSLRLQFNPLANQGVLLVIRLLYMSSDKNEVKDIDELGYGKVHVRQIRKMRKKTVGINIICGPTGSGKSTTLTYALKATMAEKKFRIAVVTIEDPPEFVIDGADQLPVVAAANEEDRNDKFTQAIRASLRNAPHIIMIGEVRDGASARLAFAAAMTGHQVYASLHANTAYGIIDRLSDLGVEDYKLADTSYLTGLIGQRLIRRLCDNCSIPFSDEHARKVLDSDVYENLIRVCGDRVRGVRFVNQDGCRNCRAGYTGREVIAECIVPDKTFMDFVKLRDKRKAEKYWLDHLEGMTILEHAVQKMVRGMCDPTDVEVNAAPLDEFEDYRRDLVFGPLFDF